jgi:hypothetical protein
LIAWMDSAKLLQRVCEAVNEAIHRRRSGAGWKIGALMTAFRDAG